MEGWQQAKKPNHEQWIFILERNSFLCPRALVTQILFWSANFKQFGFNIHSYIKILILLTWRSIQCYVHEMYRLIDSVQLLMWLLLAGGKYFCSSLRSLLKLSRVTCLVSGVRCHMYLFLFCTTWFGLVEEDLLSTGPAKYSSFTILYIFRAGKLKWGKSHNNNYFSL